MIICILTFVHLIQNIHSLYNEPLEREVTPHGDPEIVTLDDCVLVQHYFSWRCRPLAIETY